METDTIFYLYAICHYFNYFTNIQTKCTEIVSFMNRGCFSLGCVQRVVLPKVKTHFGNKRVTTEREKELDYGKPSGS